MSAREVRRWLMLWRGLPLAWALGSCGKASDGGELQLDSNTNWVKRCAESSECSGTLQCFCGQCSRVCAQDDECSLLTVASCAQSGAALCGPDVSQGGMCVRSCTSDLECGNELSCSAGQCVPGSAPLSAPAPESRTTDFIDMDRVVSDSVVDLLEQDAASRPFIRYFSLANRSNGGACGAALEPERAALTKLVNSLSSVVRGTRPIATNPSETLYRIDLRDYGWDRPFEVEGSLFGDGWEALVASNPYAVELAGDDADALKRATGTTVPFLFSNTFVASLARDALYYAFVGVPVNIDEFVATGLQIDVAARLAAHDLARVGYVDERGYVFLAERHELDFRSGSLWQISSFFGVQADLLSDPLGRARGNGSSCLHFRTSCRVMPSRPLTANVGTNRVLCPTRWAAP